MKITSLFILLSIALPNLCAQDIFRSTCQGNLARLDSLLEYSTLNDKDDRERSVLHWAVACNQKEIFHYLMLKPETDLNALDDQNKTPMHMAIRFDRPEYFDQLVQQQTNTDWIQAHGASLLESAVLKGSKPFAKKLIELGVDVDSRNNRGSTALEIAQRIQNQEMIDFLLTLDAGPSLVRYMKMYGHYIGQSDPGSHPTVFAPNFISTEEYEFGSVFNADGTEFYYGVDVGNRSEIRFTKLVNRQWTTPAVILSHEEYGYNDPFLSPDEKRLYFISRRPLGGTGSQKDDHDIWYVEREGDGWSEPINAGPQINSEGNEYYISFTQDGTLYFSSNAHDSEGNQDIYYSTWLNGAFQKPVRLGDAVNTPAYEADVFVDPEERYIIFCSTRPGGYGRGDLYISFKQPDESWSPSINMGSVINSKHHELCPYVSADGKYLLYTSNEDIYWVSTEIIETLAPK